jgi:hypothetical protein
MALSTTNPLISQGTLNRLFGSFQVVSFPALNVTPSYLGKEGIGLRFESPVTDYIETLTGGVTSPAPYQKVEVTLHLLRTQQLGIFYEQQKQVSSLLGNTVLYIDSTVWPAWTFTNCAIMNTDPMRIDGTDPSYVVLINGFYNTNAALWS